MSEDIWSCMSATVFERDAPAHMGCFGVRGACVLTRPGCLQVWDYAMYVVIVLLTLAAFAAYGDNATVGTSLQVRPSRCFHL